MIAHLNNRNLDEISTGDDNYFVTSEGQLHLIKYNSRHITFYYRSKKKQIIGHMYYFQYV